MTPADCYRAAAEFDAAFRAIVAQRQGLFAMPDGTDRRIPAQIVVSDSPASNGHTTVYAADVTDAAQISTAMGRLARSAAKDFAGRQVAHFFRLPVQDRTSAVSPPEMLPCRAMLIGTNRDAMRIQIAVGV